MSQLEQNKKLAATFSGLVYTQEKHNYNTRSARKNLLDIPLCQTFTYGTQSCKYKCIKDWNRFKTENSTENLSCCKEYTQKEYSGLLLVFLHRLFYLFTYLFIYFTLFVYRTSRERRVMFYYYYYYYYDDDDDDDDDE